MDPSATFAELTIVFAEMNGMFLSEENATAAVEQLSYVAHEMIPASAGAGVSLFGPDGLSVSTAATDDTVQAADALQYELGQGPCLSAWATGVVQRVDDTESDTRWSRWREIASRSGIRSVLSVPLSYRGQRLGALKVYAKEPQAFGSTEERLLTLLADAAATLLGAAQPTDAPSQLSHALKDSFRSRETIALATGVLVERQGYTPEEAKLAVLDMARSQGRRILEIAVDVLGGTVRGEE